MEYSYRLPAQSRVCTCLRVWFWENVEMKMVLPCPDSVIFHRVNRRSRSLGLAVVMSVDVHREYTEAGESPSSVSDPVNLCRLTCLSVFMSFPSLHGRPGYLRTAKNQCEVPWQSVYLHWALRKTVPYHNCGCMTVCLWLFTEARAGRGNTRPKSLLWQNLRKMIENPNRRGGRAEFDRWGTQRHVHRPGLQCQRCWRLHQFTARARRSDASTTLGWYIWHHWIHKSSAEMSPGERKWWVMFALKIRGLGQQGMA